MREYAVMVPQFWTGTTGKAIKRKGHSAVALAIYLFTGPNSNMIGLYYLPLVTIVHEAGFADERQARAALEVLKELKFAYYDYENETVWVPTMALYQVGEALHPKDKRRLSIEREAERSRNSPYYSEFLAMYRNTYLLSLKDEGASCRQDAPSKGLPEKKVKKEEQEQEQEQDQEQGQESKTPPPGLHELSYAPKVLQDLGLPETSRSVRIVAAAIKARARGEPSAYPAAVQYITARALDDRQAGKEINGFWFEDGKYEQQSKRTASKLDF